MSGVTLKMASRVMIGLFIVAVGANIFALVYLNSSFKQNKELEKISLKAVESSDSVKLELTATRELLNSYKEQIESQQQEIARFKSFPPSPTPLSCQKADSQPLPKTDSQTDVQPINLNQEYMKNMAYINANEKSSTCNMRNWKPQYTRLHQTMLSNKESGRFIVYECTTFCAGLADRLKGIATTFMIALLTDRAFLINWKHPASIDHVLKPHKINWKYREGEYEGLPKFKDYRMNTYATSVDYTNVDFEELLSSDSDSVKGPSLIITKFNELLPILSSEKYKEKLEYLGLWRMKEQDFIGCIMEYLFRPSEKVLTRYVQFFEENPMLKSAYIIGIQARVGGNDVSEGPMIAPEKQGWFGSCAKKLTANLQKVFKLGENEERPVRWFLSSDSSQFKQKFREQHPTVKIFQYNKKISHMDHNSDAEGMIDTVTEHFILQQSNELVISRSGFGEVAGFMTGKRVNHFRRDFSHCS